MSILLFSSCAKKELVETMPVTTSSELALELYETGMLAFDQVKLSLAYHNLEMAVGEDPDFFMAYFWMYFMSGKGSKELADQALQTSAPLNDAEQLIKSAFKYLLDGQNDKVVEQLRMAIDLYPYDPDLRKILYILQFQYLKDIPGAIASIQEAIKMRPDYALAYNQLGYAYMDLEQYEQAEEALNTYIRLAPNIANPYDSKGDFYMSTEQYGKAYDSYMKAYETDSSFSVSEKKARKAKYLLEKSDQQ